MKVCTKKWRVYLIKGVVKNMDNPYEILGVREGASADEIKRAYKELVRKYHPDQYRDNPLSDLAEEKLKEINQAYDFLMKKTEQNQSRSNQTWNQTGGYTSYAQVRSSINTGNIGYAEQLLNNMPNRDAEWYYLKGIIYYRKGWYNEALTNFQQAVNMNPSNMEYRDALNKMHFGNRSYESRVYGRSGYNNGPDMCTICQYLYCADCCCECMGGDLINCC
jgi:molecular chaperone DnaJ